MFENLETISVSYDLYNTVKWIVNQDIALCKQQLFLKNITYKTEKNEKYKPFQSRFTSNWMIHCTYVCPQTMLSKTSKTRFWASRYLADS